MGESLNLWGKQRNESLNLRHAKDTLNGMGGNKEKLTMHGHFKGDSDHNIMHVLIEHVNKMGIGSPLERKQSLLTLLLNDDREDSVLKSLEVNGMLRLDTSICERSVIMVSCHLVVKALNPKCI